MATTICRLCGNLSTNNTDIFRTNGLKSKIETCLPIILYQPCLLPDTICTQCVENVDLFYTFTKNCIQNLIILESQYEVSESCLRSKRKHDRGCSTDITNVESLTDVNVDITKYKERCEAFQRLLDGAERLLNQSSQVQLVDYDDTQDACDYQLDLREEISYNNVENMRSNKRKIGDILPHRTKMYKFCSNRRRKNTQPKKLVELKKSQDEEMSCTQVTDDGVLPANVSAANIAQEMINVVLDPELIEMPQEVIEAEVVCLLCDALFTGSDALARHVLHTHGIDMATIISSEPVPETEQYLKQQSSPLTDEYEMYPPQEMEFLQEDQQMDLQPKVYKAVVNGRQRRKSSASKTSSNITSLDHPIATAKPMSPFSCSLCSACLTNRSDLFTHLRLKHAERAALICGLCLSTNIDTFSELHTHLEQCKSEFEISERYYCKVCCYSDDSTKSMEIHIAIHDFLAGYCREEKKLFDPEEYIEHNPNTSNSDETFQCEDCPDTDVFLALSDYITHKRQAHEIFVCDLCNKSYGRSSHLWKHVHRLHKGHPTVTCPVCEKTSASKYHLAQHFVKVHTKTEEFLSKKFAAFDFQSVRQSFMKQELLIDSLVCSICDQSFTKRSSLKKHAANCRNRRQKDLLTRCKSCSRIFKDRQSLAKHLLNYHSEYTCEICATVVISKCEFISHIRFVHPNCKLFCKQCGEILRTQSELKEHLLDHDHSNVCQFCGDLLDSKIKLKMHILSLHRKILSLSCGICLKLFDDQHSLRDHVQITHKKDLNPLTSCTICGKNYGSKWKAYDHLNKSHGKMFHACRNCLAVFDELSELTKHICSSLVAIKTKEPEETTAIVNGLDSLDSNDNNRGPEDDKSSDDMEVKLEPQSDEVGEESDQEVVDTKGEEVKSKGESLRKKMCLLEKRLLGERVGEDLGAEAFNTANSPPPQLPIPPTAGKRTVYVDASAPARCDICAKTWPAKKHLWQHYIRCHRPEAATVCGICLRTNGGSYARLQRHLDADHADLLYGRGYGSNFICRVCGRYHNARSKLRMHMAIHTGYVADKGRVSSTARNNVIVRDKHACEVVPESTERTSSGHALYKESLDVLKDYPDLQDGPQTVSEGLAEEKSLNFICKAEGTDDSTSSSDSTNDDDDEDSDANQADPNDTSIHSASTDCSTTEDMDSSSSTTSTDSDQALIAHVQSSNAVDLSTTLIDDSAVLPPLDGAAVQLSHELQSAVDSIL